MQKLRLHKGAKRELEKQISRILHQMQSRLMINAPKLKGLRERVNNQESSIRAYRRQLHNLDMQYMNNL